MHLSWIPLKCIARSPGKLSVAADSDRGCGERPREPHLTCQVVRSWQSTSSRRLVLGRVGGTAPRPLASGSVQKSKQLEQDSFLEQKTSCGQDDHCWRSETQRLLLIVSLILELSMLYNRVPRFLVGNNHPRPKCSLRDFESSGLPITIR